MKLNLWESGASVSAPPVPSPGSVGNPVNRVPGVTPPTVPGAYWFYQVMSELGAVLTAGGITPSSTTLNQLLQAIQALIKADGVDSWPTSGNPTTNGLKFGNGTIIQWGVVDVNGGPVTCSYASGGGQAFPTATQAVVGISAAGFISVAETSYTATGFDATHDSGGHSHFIYVAIGH